MAPCGEQRAAAGVLARIPAELAIPGTDAMIIIDLAIVQFAEQTLIDDRFGRLELAGEAALETDAGFYLRLFHRFLHRAEVFQRKAERFLDDEMLACFGRGNDF